MTSTAPITLPTPGRPAQAGVRIVPVPTGRVSLVDRLLMQVGLALLLASTKHAARTDQQTEPRRIDLNRRPVGDARPFC
jgi:hypothetical protein